MTYRIAIDTRWIFPEITGIGSYTQELVGQLACIDQRNEYILLFDHDNVRERTMARLPSNASHVLAEMIPYSPFSPRSQVELPRHLKKLGVDLYHSPNYMIPFAAFPRKRQGKVRCVITIHDLIPLRFPHFTPKAKKTRFLPLFRWIMQQAVARADAILVPSAATRNDIFQYLGDVGCGKGHVAVVPEGVSGRYTPGRAQDVEKTRVLYVGRMDPYKNLAMLVEAFARVKTPNARLQIIGPPDSRYPEAWQRARELALGDRILWQGYVDGNSLREAYRTARVFVLPSRYEGFGLPVLEAMACGTPVICGNASSLPEVAGDAAILVDPDDVDGLARSIERVLQDDALASDLRERGLCRAREYTWEKTAEETRKVYESTLRPEP